MYSPASSSRSPVCASPSPLSITIVCPTVRGLALRPGSGSEITPANALWFAVTVLPLSLKRRGTRGAPL